MKEKVKAFWNKLTPQGKRKAIIAGVVIVITAAGILGYYTSRSKAPEQKKETKKELKFDSSVMEKSLYTETKKEMEQLRQDFEALRKEKEEESKRKESEKTLTVSPPLPGHQPSGSAGGSMPLPPPPPPPSSSPFPSSESHAQKEVAKPAVSLEKMGDIAVFTGKLEPDVVREIPEKEGDKKKEKQTSLYLPPSFMEATLLSGLYAPTVEGGKSNPVPVLLRIKDLAILPNRVKANLKGCFVIAEGYGDLATERANLRLVTLSCLSKKGQSVINQGIKGFVVDSDGKIGLKGNVVSKMGSAIARSALAGFLGGLGQAVQSAYTTTSVSLAGTTTNVAPENITKVAAGQGISQATQDLKKLYLDLAKQAMPVIEVGATKVVTLVISEGVELNIRDLTVPPEKDSISRTESSASNQPVQKQKGPQKPVLKQPRKEDLE